MKPQKRSTQRFHVQFFFWDKFFLISFFFCGFTSLRIRDRETRKKLLHLESLAKEIYLIIFRVLSLRAATVAANVLQAWEVADESELSSIGKIEYFRENNLEFS